MIFWLNLLSIGAAAWFTWVHSIAPLWGTESLYAVAQRVAALSAMALLGSVVCAASVFAILPATRGFSAALWYAPALLLMASFSPAALTGAAILLVSATLALASPTGAPRPSSSWGIAVSLAIHAAAAALLGSATLLAAAMFAVCATMLTALAVRAGALRPDRRVPNPLLGAVLTVVLAAAITAVHYGGWDGFGSGSGGGQTGGVADRGPLRGVILSADTPRISLTAPVRTSLNSGLAGNQAIPFTGEYWIYRFPFLQPPEGSLRRFGSPYDLSFSTTDRARMMMQARQVLPQPVKTDCCAALRVNLRSRDIRTGTVFLEVLLRNVDLQEQLDPRRGSLHYLDRQKIGNGEQSLDFSLRGARNLAQFNLIQFQFGDSLWLTRNPKIEVRSFAFLPR